MSIKKTQIFAECPYIILLDAGHGKDTPGKRSPEWEDGSQLLEWEFTRAVQIFLTEFFLDNKISYHIIVTEDDDVSINDRAERANAFFDNVGKPCLGVSIHGNAAGVEEANGFEIFTSPGQTKSDICATKIYDVSKDSELFKMRNDFIDGDPDKESRFGILVKTKMPFVLTESGFYTNYEECQDMLTEEFQNEIARIHYLGIRKVISNRLLDE